jgi:hypothetical protein
MAPSTSRDHADLEPVTLTVAWIERGIARVWWRPDGGSPDHFVLARTDVARSDRLVFADVVVYPTQPTPPTARAVAVATLASMATCTLVAVGVDGQGCLIRACDGHEVFVRSGYGSAAAATLCALFGYPLLALTGTLDVLVSGDHAPRFPWGLLAGHPLGR